MKRNRNVLAILFSLAVLATASGQNADSVFDQEKSGNGQKKFCIGIDALSFMLSAFTMGEKFDNHYFLINTEMRYSKPGTILGLYLGTSCRIDFSNGFGGFFLSYDAMPGISINPGKKGIEGFGLRIFPVVRMVLPMNDSHEKFAMGIGSEAVFNLLSRSGRFYFSPYAGLRYVFADDHMNPFIWEIVKVGFTVGLAF